MKKPNVVGKSVECTTCGRRKKPWGRSEPLGSYLCDSACPGFLEDPGPGQLWPGETQKDFGYCLPLTFKLTLAAQRGPAIPQSPQTQKEGIAMSEREQIEQLRKVLGTLITWIASASNSPISIEDGGKLIAMLAATPEPSADAAVQLEGEAVEGL